MSKCSHVGLGLQHLNLGTPVSGHSTEKAGRKQGGRGLPEHVKDPEAEGRGDQDLEGCHACPEVPPRPSGSGAEAQRTRGHRQGGDVQDMGHERDARRVAAAGTTRNNKAGRNGACDPCYGLNCPPDSYFAILTPGTSGGDCI